MRTNRNRNRARTTVYTERKHTRTKKVHDPRPKTHTNQRQVVVVGQAKQGTGKHTIINCFVWCGGGASKARQDKTNAE